jgi:peptidylprolyl isomerase
LQLDAAGVEAMADGFELGLEDSFEASEYPREDMEAAFAQAQARAEAAEAAAAELPAISDDDLIKIGSVIAFQSGIKELGFTAKDTQLLRKGFVAGATVTEMDPAIEAKMEAFHAYIQPRAEQAQAAAMAAQQAAMAAQKAEAMAEFQATADAWKQKDPMTVVFETTQGEVEIELMPAVAPLAVANFVGHVEAGYYDDLIFHRVIPDFMIQGGDPQGTGTGGESIWGKPFPDEFSPEVRFDTEGLLAMANSGPTTNGSQFFITTSAPEWLNDKHTIFGKVTKGYDVVEKIEGVETAAGDKPVETQKIVKAYLK